MVVGLVIGIFAIAACLAYLAYFRGTLQELARVRFGEIGVRAVPLVLIFLACVLYVCVLVLAEKRSKKYALLCPNCTADLSRSTARVIATRCCAQCDVQIVRGKRIRKTEVYKRHLRLKQRRFLAHWFWTWPTLGAFTLLCYAIEPSVFSTCMPVTFLPGVIGVTASGWTMARTMDQRYLPQFAASILVFCIGATVFWNSSLQA